MSRVFTFAILGILIIILGAMSYVLEKSTKPEPPKPPSAKEIAEQQKRMQEQMKQQAEARKKMVEAARKQAEAAKRAAQKGTRPINPTAPEPPKAKNTVPPGALDISEDWFRKRRPGAEGLKELQKKAQQQTPVVPPPPSIAPAVPVR